MADRKKPGVAFYATVMLVVVLSYVASFGPACWITSRANVGNRVVSVVYRPLLMLADTGIAGVDGALLWYAYVGSPDEWAWASDNEGVTWEWERITY